MDDEAYMRRALRAYYRSGSDRIPSRHSGVCFHEGRAYVRLESGSDILALYRVTDTGRLKRLQRWPKTLNLD